MTRRLLCGLAAGLLGVCLWALNAPTALAQTLTPPAQQNYNLSRWFYYPYYYFPHNYWPTQGPRWPEPPGAPTMRPPAWMAYPPFREPNWRYELFEPQPYYRGFHFWLDQF